MSYTFSYDVALCQLFKDGSADRFRSYYNKRADIFLGIIDTTV